MKTEVAFRTFEEFWSFCRRLCPDFKTGCANECELRKKLGIPPFSRSYEGKETGAIKEEV